MEEANTVEQHNQLVSALQSEFSKNSGETDVEVIQTHISSVLLTGTLAYKIKKPVDFGFLNFSTLAARRHFCAEEIRLNKRLAPRLYIDAVPITGTLEAPILEGDGEAIEYAVKMHRFDQSQLLDRLLATGKLQASIIDDIADMVAAFHSKAAVAPAESRFGEPEQVYAPVAQNFEQIRPLLTDPEQLDQVDRLEARKEARYHQLKPLMSERKSQGMIRECHGDMHLGNMTLYEGDLQIFDGIEFNEDFRWIDVMSELAFLTMDLTDRGARNFAQRVMNRYLETTGDYAGLPLLRFYQSYRAVVRAKVAGLRLSQADVSDEERSQILKAYQSYMDLAEDFVQHGKPMLILMHGLSGSGKSWLSQGLVERMEAFRIRSDRERKRLFEGQTIKSHELNAGLYSSQATEATYDHLRQLAQTIIGAGYVALVDATFLKRAQRDPFYALAEQLGVPCKVIYAHAPEAVMQERIARRAHETGNISDANQTVLSYQLEHVEHPSADEPVLTVSTDGEVDFEQIIHKLNATPS